VSYSPDENVYFFKPVGMDGPVKIGWSVVPAKRVAEYAVWSPFPLELIGSVPGKYADEQFLHQCFHDVHSHLEWFYSTPLLREIIAKVLAAGSVDAVRGIISPKGSVRKKVRRPLSAVTRCHLSLGARIRHALRKIGSVEGDTVFFYTEPDEIRSIINRLGREDRMPSPAEKTRLEEFILNVQTQATPRQILRIPNKAERAA
jgi:hypothetical protein